MPKLKKAKTDKLAEKLAVMTHVDGQDHARARQIQVSSKKTLDEIWGRKFSKFETNDPVEYQEKLRNLTKLDLQQECIKIGLMPHDNRETMIERLAKECARCVAAAETSSLQPIAIKMSDAGRRASLRASNGLL